MYPSGVYAGGDTGAVYRVPSEQYPDGCVIWDILFGSLATLAGAIGTYLLRNHKFVFTLPPVAANMIVVPLVLQYAYGVPDAVWYLAVTVGAGEVISVCILGMLLYKVLYRQRKAIFR